MKTFRINIFAAMAFTLSALVFTACSEAETKGNQSQIAETEYACPMDCENGKTYAEEGACPVCGMDLTEVE